VQQNLWHDGYSILTIETGAIGQTRLRRFLNWLDAAGYDWSEPHLDDYAAQMRDLQLHASTIYQNISELREHYLIILSDPTNYAHIQPEKRAEVVNTILKQLGFKLSFMNYARLIRGEDAPPSMNMHILLPPSAHLYRDTQLTNFISWLDQTKRHWTNPDLLYYKEFLLNTTDLSTDVINNAITAVRRRYYELVEDEEILEGLPDAQRRDFLQNLRKRLGYLDQYPSRSAPVRSMLEDDPYNKQYLEAQQVTKLLNKPDLESFVGVRDRAMISLALATGTQQYEIASVEVHHLRCDYQGKTALFVAEGKQREARYVPYDEYEWVLEWVEQWIELAGIQQGPIFRGTYGNRDVLRPHQIAPETASDILARYPIHMHGSDIPLLFADLRATCARRWYDSGITLDEIERRLGVLYRRATLKMLGLRVRKAFGG